MNFQNNNQITDLSYISNDFPSLHPIGREFTVDIVCKTAGDRFFLIEMQNDY